LIWYARASAALYPRSRSSRSRSSAVHFSHGRSRPAGAPADAATVGAGAEEHLSAHVVHRRAGALHHVEGVVDDRHVRQRRVGAPVAAIVPARRPASCRVRRGFGLPPGRADERAGRTLDRETGGVCAGEERGDAVGCLSTARPVFSVRRATTHTSACRSPWVLRRPADAAGRRGPVPRARMPALERWRRRVPARRRVGLRRPPGTRTPGPGSTGSRIRPTPRTSRPGAATRRVHPEPVTRLRLRSTEVFTVGFYPNTPACGSAAPSPAWTCRRGSPRPSARAIGARCRFPPHRALRFRGPRAIAGRRSPGSDGRRWGDAAHRPLADGPNTFDQDARRLPPVAATDRTLRRTQ
jgi:hypothetical protein